MTAPDPHSTALLVIDMQVGMLDDPRHEWNAVVTRINTLARRLRDSSGTVVFIQQDGPVADRFEPHTPGWEILPAMERSENDRLVRKHACDSFYHTDLDDLLAEVGAKQLLITGCATDFCVDTTLRAAVSRDYAVTAVADGHTTADRPALAAEQVIRHHNWVWENLIVSNGCVGVRPTASIVEDLLKADPSPQAPG